MIHPISKAIPYLLFALFFISSCHEDIDYDYRNEYVGEYLFTVQRSCYDDFSGSTNKTVTDTGEIFLFEGHAGNQDDIGNKLGIILNNDSTLLYHWETSCYNGLTYGAYDYLHPTVAEDGKLTYPEYECYAWAYGSSFSGSATAKIITMSYGYYDATHGCNYDVSGVRIE
ncbi:MAG: hypothetical protein CMF84_01005 [Candidatus Marinimicrobia bacterium]|nr:hypothetical protein [Candidatus Neomarinimicrobiota bacterium]